MEMKTLYDSVGLLAPSQIHHCGGLDDIVGPSLGHDSQSQQAGTDLMA